MYYRTSKHAFTTNYLASKHWYERLAKILTLGNKAAAFLALTEELVEQLSVDSMMLLHFPASASPSLLYGSYDHPARSNTIGDYLSGNYAIDPFYMNRQSCRNSDVTTLQEVIEEDFAASEYYKVHYSAAGLVDEVCIFCSNSQSGYVALSLCRAVGRDRFNNEEIAALQQISPLVKAYMRQSWYLLKNYDQQADSMSHNAEQMHLHIENARINFGKSILTAREFDVLQLFLRGNSVGLIARKLEMSEGTVKVHRKHIYAKLEICSQSEVFSLFLDVVSSTDYIPNHDPMEQYIAVRSGDKQT